MILKESPKTYPVYTRHEPEVYEMCIRVAEQMSRSYELGHNMKRFESLQDLHLRLIRLLLLLREAPGSVVLVNRENRELLEKVVNWLKNHPEHQAS